jgi:flagellar biosynthesis chaperone FliJ
MEREMKRFQFSLETLLSLRKEKEQECEIALAVASGELMMVEKRAEEARRAGESAFLAGGRTIEDLRTRDLLWLKSVNDVKALEKPRKEAAAKTDEARKKYTEAHTQRAALDRLRDKRFGVWKKQVKKEDVKRLDEVAKGSVVRLRLTGGDE